MNLVRNKDKLPRIELPVLIYSKLYQWCKQIPCPRCFQFTRTSVNSILHMEKSDLTHMRRSAPYDYVYIEVRKRVGEGKRLNEFGQSASASDMDTLKPRVEVKNNVFKENLLF